MMSDVYDYDQSINPMEGVPISKGPTLFDDEITWIIHNIHQWGIILLDILISIPF